LACGLSAGAATAGAAAAKMGPTVVAITHRIPSMREDDLRIKQLLCTETDLSKTTRYRSYAASTRV
jgi:hypothetical protein